MLSVYSNAHSFRRVCLSVCACVCGGYTAQSGVQHHVAVFRLILTHFSPSGLRTASLTAAENAPAICYTLACCHGDTMNLVQTDAMQQVTGRGPGGSGLATGHTAETLNVKLCPGHKALGCRG